MEERRKKSRGRKIAVILGGMILLIGISGWVFFTYYFEDAINSYITPKLQEVVRVATEGRFELKIGRIVREGRKIYCTHFVLQRVRYDSTESGITLERLTEDTVRFYGLHIWDLLRGRGLFISRMEMRSPKMDITEVPHWQGKIGTASGYSLSTKLPEGLQVVAFDSIDITGIQISLPKKYRPSGDDSLIRGAGAHLANFRLDDESMITEPLLYSKHVDLMMPKLRFNVEDGLYTVEAGPMHANLTDSLLVIDSAVFASKYSEEDFSAREKYRRGQLDIRSSEITVSGVDLLGFIQSRKLAFQKCTVSSWSVDYYSDKRKPKNPHPPAAVMPNDLLRNVRIPVDIDSVILNKGSITIRERAVGSSRAGVLKFDRARIIAAPYCTDTASQYCGKPTRITMSALFLGEAPVRATVISYFQKPKPELSIDAIVGKFSVLKLNEFLIPNERKEVTDGTVEDGTLRMDIADGVAHTTVLPHYHHLSMKVLTEKTGQKRGLLEGLKTFVANLFVLHSPNMDKFAITGRATYKRKSDEEFLQFIWIAIRKALGKVIGGF